MWRLTSHLLPEFVHAESYVVYVPDDEQEAFRNFTNSNVEVRSQKLLDRGYTEKLTTAMEEKGNLPRLGWYRQQFYKIQALLDSDKDAQVIWDGDCVPVKPQSLFSRDGQPQYMRAREMHQPYFEMIQRLMGLSRVQDFSFVIPGFPMLKPWGNEFVDYVAEKNQGRAWSDAIISTTDLGLASGFSETETLGTWVANLKQGQWSAFDVAWERLGQSRFGPAKSFTPESIVALGAEQNFDIISFENWDVAKKKKRSLAKRVMRRLRR